MPRRYELVFSETNDGTIHSDSINDGFTGVELMGLMELKMRDLYEQLRCPEKFECARVVKNADGTYNKIDEKENKNEL